MNSKKVRTISLVSGLAVLLAIIVAFSFYLAQEKQRQIEERNRQYVIENTHTFAMGESAVLNSEEDDKGFDLGGGYVASFGWQGTMELVVTKAKAGDSLEEAGIAPANSQPNGQTDSSKKCIVLTMKLHNKDALSGINGDRFYISTFVNLFCGSSTPGIADIVYFDGTAPDADPKKGRLNFVLGKGEEKEFTVGLEVPTKYLEEDLFMGIGNSHYEKYRVKIAFAEEA